MLGLERMHAALARLGHPERQVRAVHVAGTNGKGSVSAMLASILRHHGLRVGLYTSPHLCRFNERISIDGAPIDDAAFADALDAAHEASAGEASVFEALTLAAFVAFSRARLDVAILEVGLGGRLDATNVLDAPLACAITSIGLDHTHLLGPDHASIAREKAGIAKRGCPLVIGPLSNEAARATRDLAIDRGATPRMWVVESPVTAEPPHDDFATLRIGADTGTLVLEGSVELTLAPALQGRHQLRNAAVAAAVAWQLRANFPGVEAAIENGIQEARWPGRLEMMRVGHADVLLDCAHNLEGIETLAAHLERGRCASMCLVFGALEDKPWPPMLDRLAPLAKRRHYAPPLEATAGRRSVDGRLLAEAWPGSVHASVEDALSSALENAAEGGLVVVAGSIFLVGAARARLLGLPRHAAIPL